MAWNGSELINDPFNQTFKSFTDFFQLHAGYGNLFWIIPLAVIGLAIYIKTESPMAVSMYLIGSGALLGSGNIFAGNLAIGMFFIVIASAGFVGLIYSLYLNHKGGD